MDKATPLPWKQAEQSHPTRRRIFSLSDAEIAPCEAWGPIDSPDIRDANAALIVHCVNNFAAVVEALEKMSQLNAFRGDRIPLRDKEVNSWFAAASAALAAANNISQ